MTTPVRASGEVRLARPLIVELIGVPGSGKTTLVPGIHAALRSGGWEPLSPDDGARQVVARLPLGRLVARIGSPRLRRALWWRLYLGYRLTGAVRVVTANPGHFRRLVAGQRRRPATALARRRRVVHWLVRTMGAQEFFRRHAAEGEAVVFDEGYAHRVVQIYSSPVDAATPDAVSEYLGWVPRPDLLVAVHAPAGECAARVRDRGVWDRLSGLRPDQVDAFVANAAEVVGHAVAHARSHGWPLVEVDNTGVALVEAAAAAAELVKSAIPAADERRRPRRRPLYRFRVPRPGRVIRTLRGRTDPPAIAPETVDAVLGRYGIARTGRIENLPLGRRSDSVALTTDTGRLVVRRYAEHWPDDSIHHEHAVLGYLASVGYPSTRLVGTRDGESMVVHEGRRIALYRFARGANLSGSYVTARAGLEALHLAGRLLARLHDVTAELEPVASHHLALEGDGRSRIDGQLLLLDELAAAPSSHPTAEWLRSRAPQIGKRLVELHSELMETGVAVSVIHGDYGLHNILLSRDGSAVVHDFELARRDWRMVDLVEVLTAVPVPAGRSLLAGYRFEVGSQPAEWEHLAAMWEYHRLGGAIRSWESFVRRGDFARLAAANRRLAAADRIAAEGVAAWL